MKRVILITTLVLGFFILKLVYQAGQFTTITNSSGYSIKASYNNMPGPEDMEIDHQTGLLFISSCERRPGSDADDGIYVLDLEGEKAPQKLSSDVMAPLHPHGISLYRKDSMLYLLTVNHAENGNFVESFEFVDGALQHLASYTAENLCCPNDLVAVAKDKFYVTNDHGHPQGVLRIIEDYVRIPMANIMYFNGTKFTEVAGPFFYANGINVSPNGQYLYVAETTGMDVSVYEIEKPDHLHQVTTIDVDTGVDNIDVDEQGHLWIGSHPKLLTFLKHVKDSTVHSPTQVIELVPQKDNHFAVNQIYMNDGSEISAGSVAIPYGNELFIGAVLDRNLLRVELEAR